MVLVCPAAKVTEASVCDVEINDGRPIGVIDTVGVSWFKDVSVAVTSTESPGAIGGIPDGDTENWNVPEEEVTSKLA